MITGVNHIAIICSDYNKSKHFYHEILGFEIIAENYRATRNSWKLDLRVNAQTAIELFSFEDAPPRLSYPEGRGLRHICFSVTNLDATIKKLSALGITFEAIRIDEYTGKRFVFFADPDDLPIELYEQ